MADPIRGTLTGFTHALSRHGAKVVPHDAATLASFKSVGISRENSSAFAVVDGVKVYRAAERDAMDFAIRRMPIPSHMQYVEGQDYAAPESAPQQQAKQAMSEIDAILDSVKSSLPPGVVAVPTAAMLPSAPLDAELNAEARMRANAAAAQAQAQITALSAKITAQAAEIAALKAVMPVLAENTVSVEIPGFGSIELIVDYLYQKDNVLVMGVLKSKKRAQAVPKPAEGKASVAFSAKIQGKHYDLIAYGEFKFPVGDLEVQAFLIAGVQG